MHAIVTETKELCRKENELNAQIIKNLQVIYDQKIYLEMGFSSLFDFCLNELNLCRSNAQRKIDAVRLSAVIKDLPEQIEKGAVSLSKVSQFSVFMRQEKKFAERKFSKTEIKEIFNEVKAEKSEKSIEKLLMEKSHMVVKPTLDKHRVVAGGRHVLEIEVDEEYLENQKKIQDLVSHKGFQTKLEHLKMLQRFFLEKNHPEYKKSKPVPRGTEIEKQKENQQVTKMNFRRQQVPQNLRAKVWQKAKSQCTYTDPKTNKRCDSTFRLQIQHIKAVAHGGLNTEENLTLYCQAHNLFHADQVGLLGKYKQQELF